MSGLAHAPSIRNLPTGKMENIKKMFESEGGNNKQDRPRDTSPAVSMRNKMSSPRPTPRKVLPVQSMPIDLKSTSDPPPGFGISNIKREQQLKHHSYGAKSTDIVTQAHVSPSVLKRISALQDPDSNKDEDSVKLTKPAKPKWMKNIEDVDGTTSDVKPVASNRAGKREVVSCYSKMSSAGNTSPEYTSKLVSKSKTDGCIYKPGKVDQCVPTIKVTDEDLKSQTKAVAKAAADVGCEKLKNNSSDDEKRHSETWVGAIGDRQSGGKNADKTISGGTGISQTKKVSERINEGQGQGQNKRNPTKISLAPPPRPAQPPRARPRSVRQNSIGCASEYEYSPIWVEHNKQFTFKNTHSTEVGSSSKTSHVSDKSLGAASSPPSVPSGAPRKAVDTSAHARPVGPPPPPPPRKPPRTGAHDIYIETKLRKSKEVELIDNILYVPCETDVRDGANRSVRSRISSLLESQLQTKDDSVIHRHPKPFQPNMSKRPISIATDCMNVSQPINSTRVKPDLPRRIRHEYEEIKEIDDRPVKGNVVRAAVDELTHRPLQRFPLRKSFSSDNLCFVNTLDDVPVYIDSALSIGFDKFQDDRYEAYVDEEGYAVPHAFVKRHPGEKRCLDKSLSSAADSGAKSRIGVFRKRIISDGQDRSIPVQEQDPTKVNKRKMNQVKQRLNDAFAAIQKYVRHDQELDVDEKCADGDTISVDSDGSIDKQEIKKRVEYISSVKQKTYQSIKKRYEFMSKIYPQLFEYALVVGLKSLPGGSGYKPYIIHKFPEIVDSNMSVPLFCFPDAAEFESTGSTVSESYHFVLTNIDGGKVYGYCRRMQPPESKLPEVICIISPIDAFNMYNSLLNEIEKKRNVSLDLAQELLAASFGRPLPNPGKVVHIRALDQAGEMETIFLTRPSDSRLENVNYECLQNYLGTDKLLRVFSTLLMERRVLICASNLSCLSHTIHALAALLYPFQWQHIYVPILPQDMLDVCASPTPFLMGILSSHLNQVLTLPLEEVLIIDLDKKEIVLSVGDESSIIPKKLQKALKTAINMCKLDADAQSSQWLMVSEAFLRFFVETIGHFGEHIRTQQDGKKVFLKELFVSSVASKGIRHLLEWFSETQMFEVFVTDNLEKTHWGSVDLFMSRLAEYQKCDDGSSSGLGKRVMNFLRKL
ncbi:uncharacterized protein LOC121382310 isoform X2 [Gigantopelta aegis]|uniref:uncharacterized protein LOC121382310 isoform X2 n=1 Tax=Gigantopelta aegis TaxID=1735272 RepID=UPI001B88A71D|nr:uncharacterized protein LOC121382310 isoform X2 [Gigantopelta aegis]